MMKRHSTAEGADYRPQSAPDHSRAPTLITAGRGFGA